MDLDNSEHIEISALSTYRGTAEAGNRTAESSFLYAASPSNREDGENNE